MLLFNIFSLLFILYNQAYWISSLLPQKYISSLTCNLTYTTLLSTFKQLNPDENILQKLEKIPEDVDFIIVGAGSAGCVLANRLSENKSWNVILIEEGGEEPLIASIPASLPALEKISRHYQTISDGNFCLANNGCNYISGKVMGGTSSINGMLYVRGNKEDFDNWAKMGNPGWRYEEVLPYFIKSEDNRDKDIVRENPGYHGIGGYQSLERLSYKDPIANNLLKALREIGYNDTDLNGANQIGSMHAQAIAKDGSRASANVAFIRPIREKRSNLLIRTNARVIKIIIDTETKRAIGVEFISTKTGATKVVMARKEVIVSAGTIESAKLLMISGIGPRDELQKHNINVVQNSPVGQNLQDHVTFMGIRYKLQEGEFLYNPDCAIRQLHLNEYLKFKNGPFSSVGIPHATAFLQSHLVPNSSAPDIQFIFLPNTTSTDSCMYYNSFYQKIILLSPKSRGYVKLNESDPFWGNPVINFKYFSDSSDLERIIKGNQIGLKLINTTAVGESIFKFDTTPLTNCEQYEFNTENYWRCSAVNYTTSLYHSSGTCKMGPRNDSEAVVDARLRVYGIKSLRVADASIMPFVTRANLHATIMMIAEKAGAMIKEDWT
ncbi:glucose dehydrogenase [FAD, quinone]-like [Leptopilina boulardi]|uniref:glucose dehydrogenase [FAD, quinone]-like n=1 Tax=Leptopilina boulardi TaxID=63433 RepID=UPI0021F6668F|nr:glucose dehydrogenase [FAD, quinone]-like [Leptopilina boulardi]